MFVETLRHESYSLALSTAPQLAMTQEQLCGVWLHAQHGRLSAWEQAKALALREASRELHGRTLLVWIAARVEKAGGDYIVADKLQAKRVEPSRSHPGAIGGRGWIAKYDFIIVDKL